MEITALIVVLVALLAVAVKFSRVSSIQKIERQFLEDVIEEAKKVQADPKVQAAEKKIAKKAADNVKSVVEAEVKKATKKK